MSRADDSDLEHSGFFALRTPLLPFDDFSRWADGVTDRGLLRERLRDAVTRPELREAIFLASPDVESLVDAWAAAPDSAEGRRCERALVRYFSRAAGRCTPHGLLAGVAWGRIGDATELALVDRRSYLRRAQISLECLLAIVERARTRPAVAAAETFRPNPTLYRVGEAVRFMAGGGRVGRSPYTLVTIPITRALEDVLRAASSGAALAQLVDAAGGTTRSARFVERLIAVGLVTASRPATLTQADAEAAVRSWAARCAAPDVAETLEACAAELAELSREPAGVPVERYRLVEESLGELAGGESSGPRVRVDLTKPASRAVLGADVVEEIARGVELAHRLGRPNAPDPELERFRERFNERYGWSEVPLLEALDPEIGIGFGAGPERRAPLVEDVFVPAATRETAWGAREDWLLARLWELQRRNVDELLLSAHDIEELAGTATVRRPLPDELSCIAALAAGSPGDLRSGRFRVLIKEYGGPGRVGTLGRFCLADPGLREAVRSHLRAEEALDEEAIVAEIVHLPSQRHADLLARPLLREYEIDCLGPSGAPPVRQIQLSDLRLSVGREGHLVLRSERLDRRVVPRLTAAHNFEAFGAKPYRFLCKLQFQGTATGADFWGPLAAMQHLPRVRSGRIVLERARWRLTEADVPAIQRWRAAAGAPRFVGLSEQDMELPVDLDNVLSVESLAQAVRSNGEALLVEWFPQPGELCVHGPEGEFVHELLVPFVRARPVPRPRRTHRPPREAEEPRRPFAPGSEWLYARWFVNASAIDRVLLDVVGALVRRLREAGAIDRWFFMRSDDPVFHLRLRLHTVDTHGHAEAREALRAAAEPLLGLGVVAHVELATYVRETGRYGGPEAFALAEEMFHADSDAVLELLPLIRGDPSGEARWRLALQGMHALLVDLALDLDARLDLARDVRAALVREEAISADDAKRIGQRFRRERGDLAQLLMEPPGSEPVFAILEARSERVRPLGDRLREVERNGLLTRPLREVAASIAHMHLNRVVQARHREHELVIYDFLTRLYEAASHRKEE